MTYLCLLNNTPYHVKGPVLQKVSKAVVISVLVQGNLTYQLQNPTLTLHVELEGLILGQHIIYIKV